MDLHQQGLILWPLGALWGRSALGEVNEQRFARSVEEHDPGLYDVRIVILETDHFQNAAWTEREKSTRSFIFWKFAAALHFAGEGIDGIEQIQEVHVVKMAEMLKVNNKWKPWVPYWPRRTSAISRSSWVICVAIPCSRSPSARICGSPKYRPA
jgi:hypothetical protein